MAFPFSHANAHVPGLGARIAVVALLASIPLALSAAGCGGSVFSSDGSGNDGGTSDGATADGGGSDGSTGSDAADAGDSADSSVFTTCPGTPAPGAPCAPNGLACEYGTDPNAACDPFQVCQSGAFQKYNFPNPPQTCPTPTPANESKCAPTHATVPVGTACNDDGLECAYPEGICACTRNTGGGPIGTIAKWVCPTPASGCPAARPRIGSACPTNGQQCNYGECTYRGGVNLKCDAGLWQHEASPCPV